MPTNVMQGRNKDAVRQFSVFIANRMGRLNDLIALLSSNSVHVLAITILDTTDSAIVRLVVDDPENARHLMEGNGFAFTESELLVVEIDTAVQLPEVMAALLEAEININYLYCFIIHPGDKSILAVSMEDNEVGEKVLTHHSFRVLRQSDVSR